MIELKVEELSTDILIIGGGTAGCYAALTISEEYRGSILIAEKANIKRSGCLAAGVNALNAYIIDGYTPEDYVNYAKTDAKEIVREDLLITMAKGLNKVTKKLEELGLVIQKDEEGNYIARGNRNIKINGENIKPILANAITNLNNVTVLNQVNIIDYIVIDNQIYGAIGIHVKEEVLYVLKANYVICATGGASGLYRPNNPGHSRHKMWYPPFNTGAGYAMGIRSGAEMTTFEMRFIALRCKDTIAPTGTIAQGVGAKQVNKEDEVYETKYGLITSNRLYGTVKEGLDGRGPCYLKTKGISKKEEEDLFKAYLNMAPSQTLKWIEEGIGPREENVEIEGTEPYIIGGHTASGYWVDTNRETTIKGLYAVGDVAGGCPQKYVTGAMVEGEIAGKAIASKANSSSIREKESKEIPIESKLIDSKFVDIKFIEGKLIGRIESIRKEAEVYLNNSDFLYQVEELEEAMQKVMDTYAGGIGSNYHFNEEQLKLADRKISQITKLTHQLCAKDMHELVFIYELKERLIVCKSVIAHLKERKETRWHSFCENTDYPNESKEWLKYVNSKMIEGNLNMIHRELVKKGEMYEHRDS
jgi:adenylylsulfate reductase subunit A